MAATVYLACGGGAVEKRDLSETWITRENKAGNVAEHRWPSEKAGLRYLCDKYALTPGSRRKLREHGRFDLADRPLILSICREVGEGE